MRRASFLTRALIGLFAGLAMVVVTAGLTPNLAMAATNQQILTVSPASTSPSVNPGGTYDGSVSVLNSGFAGYNVSIYAKPYYVSGLNYDPHFTQLPGTTDASAWVHPGKTTTFIPKSQLVSIPYTLAVPAGTAPGGYYAVLFVETQPTTGAGVQSRSRVGDILYITVKGAVKEGGSIVSTPIPHFSTARSLPLSLEVSDTGGIHFLTTANIVVKNLFGKTVFNGSYQRYILPQTIREISANWKTASIGFYHISRSATVAGRQQSLPQQWVVVVQPWVLIVIAVLIALVVAYSLFRKRGTKKRRSSK